MPWAQNDPNWRKVTNPGTGQGFATWDEYNTWSKGQEAGARAAGADAGKAASSADRQGDWNQTKGYNWAGTGGYRTDDKGNIITGQAGQNGFGSWGDIAGQNGLYSGGQVVINQRTGQIEFQDPSLDPRVTNAPARVSSTTRYEPTMDYGLGVPGVIPVAHDPKTGAPTAYYAMMPGGGGKVFTDANEAALNAQQYASWAQQQGLYTPPTTGKEGAAGSGTAGTGQTGVLMYPGEGEKFWDSTKGFYTQPTRASDAYDKYSKEDPQELQYWRGVEGKFKDPTNAETLYGNYDNIFSDPHYLDSFYDYQQKNAQTALDRRAASAGVGDSGAAARATGNLGAVFANQKLNAMQGFAKTGMDLAGAADTSKNQRLSTGAQIAALAEQGINNRITEGNVVDSGELARRVAGQNAANQAQGLYENRLTGGFDRGEKLATDMAFLTQNGAQQATSSKLMADIGALQYQVDMGQIDATLAGQKAQELLALNGVAMKPAVNAWLMQKFGGGGGGMYGGRAAAGTTAAGAANGASLYP